MEIPLSRRGGSFELNGNGWVKAGRLGGEGRFAGVVARQRGGASFRQSNGDRDEDGRKSKSGFPRVRRRAKDRLSHGVSPIDTVWLGRRWRYQRQRRPLDLLIEPAEFAT